MKNMTELREVLCEQIDALRAKTTTPVQVNAICNATGKILASIKLEIEYCRLMGRRPESDFMKLVGPAKEPTEDAKA